MANDTQDWSIRVNVDTTLSGALSVDIGDGKMILDKLDFISTGIKLYNVSPTASAGVNWRTLTELPSGQVWLIHKILAYNLTNVCSTIAVYAQTHAAPPRDIYLASRGSPPAGEACITTNNIILTGRDQICAIYYGCTNGDNLGLFAYGYQLKL